MNDFLIPKRHAHRDPKYRAAAQHMDCIVNDEECHGDVVLAHYRGGWGAMQEKPHDYWAFPLCHFHHEEQGRAERHWWATLLWTRPDVLDKIMHLAGEALHARWRGE